MNTYSKNISSKKILVATLLLSLATSQANAFLGLDSLFSIFCPKKVKKTGFSFTSPKGILSMALTGTVIIGLIAYFWLRRDAKQDGGENNPETKKTESENKVDQEKNSNKTENTQKNGEKKEDKKGEQKEQDKKSGNTTTQIRKIDLELIDACKNNDKDKVIDCINKGANVNATVIDELTKLECRPLDYAIYFPMNNWEIGKILIEHGAEVNHNINSSSTCRSLGFTPICCACMSNNLEMVKLLCQKGADVNKESLGSSKTTPLIEACRNKNLDIVKYLVEEKNADIHKIGGDCGKRAKNPLHWVLGWDDIKPDDIPNIEIVKLLVERTNGIKVTEAEISLMTKQAETMLEIKPKEYHAKIENINRIKAYLQEKKAK